MVGLDLTVAFYDAASFELVSRFNDDPMTRYNDLTIDDIRKLGTGWTQQQRRRASQSPTMLSNIPVCVANVPSSMHVRFVLVIVVVPKWYRVGRQDMMAIGDTTGSIRLVELVDKWHACDGRVASCSHESPKCQGVAQWTMAGIHSDWVTDIKWIPELDALVTSSLDRTVKFLDIDKRSVRRIGCRRLVGRRRRRHGHRRYSFVRPSRSLSSPPSSTSSVDLVVRLQPQLALGRRSNLGRPS